MNGARDNKSDGAGERETEEVSLLLSTIEQQRLDIVELNTLVQEIAGERDGLRQRVREQRERISAAKQATLHERAAVTGDTAEWLRKAALVLTSANSGGWRGRLYSVLPGYFGRRRQWTLLKRKGLFDERLYKSNYKDVARSAVDPLHHYIRYGILEGRIGGNRSILATAEASAMGLTADLIHLDNGPSIPPHGLRIAVHAHMYYPELAREFAECFARIPCAFAIYASTPNDNAQAAVTRAFSAIPNASLVDVRVVPNRGRDIGPFLVEFGRELASYDIVAHVHTKKSLYNDGATDGWREYILNSLFPSGNGLSYLFRLLDEERYGLIYPQCFANLPYTANTWLANAGPARAWAPRFGLKTLPEGYFDFPAGSMFWSTSNAIRPFLEAGLDWSDFPPEQGQTDATLAHCVERMLGAVPSANGFRHGVIRDEGRPSWSRWRLEQFFGRPQSHFLGLMKRPKIPVVAFDIFDTLITRPLLNPDYVKHLLHDELGAAGTEDFLDRRVQGEAAARNRKGKDVDIHEIYRHCDIATAGGTALSAEREIELEIASVRPRRDAISLLRAAVDAGKRVILISDMFLPRTAIEAMLEKCGVTGWHKLYLSSEIGLRKDSGKLYEHVLAEEEITPDQIIMVGDNERSDFQIPCDMKFHVGHVLKPTAIMSALPRMERIVPDARTAPLSDQFLFGAIASENFAPIFYPNFSAEDMFGASPRAIGFGLLGPITLCFSQWLADQAEKEGFQQLHFLAREGQLLKAVFDRWQAGQASRVKTRYLHVSRRAVTVPTIGSIGDIFAIAESNNFYGARMAVFLEERFGTVLSDSIWAESEKAGFWRRNDRLRINDGDIDHIRPFLRFIAPEILKTAASERSGAQEYFRTAGVGSDERIAVVDVGYGATIQKHMMKLLDREIDGLYMMTHVKAQSVAAQRSVIAKGCFADAVGQYNPAPPMYNQSFLLEKMLSSDDEQVIQYAPDGRPVFRAPQVNAGAAKAVRKELQDGALAFVEEAVRFRDEMGVAPIIAKDRCHQLYSGFVERLSKAEKDIFSTLALDDFYCGRGYVVE